MIGRHHARILQQHPQLVFAGAVDPGGDRYGAVARLLVTSTMRDGSLAGPDVGLLAEVLAASLPVIAAGGVSSLDDAVKYINGQSAGKPFYLYLTFNAPHTPYQAPQDYIDRFKNVAEPSPMMATKSPSSMDSDTPRKAWTV